MTLYHFLIPTISLSLSMISYLSRFSTNNGLFYFDYQSINHLIVMIEHSTFYMTTLHGGIQNPLNSVMILIKNNSITLPPSIFF
jgi:hypothetical protein